MDAHNCFSTPIGSQIHQDSTTLCAGAHQVILLGRMGLEDRGCGLRPDIIKWIFDRIEQREIVRTWRACRYWTILDTTKTSRDGRTNCVMPTLLLRRRSCTLVRQKRIILVGIGGCLPCYSSCKSATLQTWVSWQAFVLKSSSMLTIKSSSILTIHIIRYWKYGMCQNRTWHNRCICSSCWSSLSHYESEWNEDSFLGAPVPSQSLLWSRSPYAGAKWHWSTKHVSTVQPFDGVRPK